jgi:rhodanese-related sulfurtransferase
MGDPKPETQPLGLVSCRRVSPLLALLIRRILLSQQIQRFFILFDIRESTDWFVEAIIGAVVVDLGDFADKDLPLTLFPPEAMVLAGGECDTLAGCQANRSAGFDEKVSTIDRERYRGIGEEPAFL